MRDMPFDIVCTTLVPFSDSIGHGSSVVGAVWQLVATATIRTRTDNIWIVVLYISMSCCCLKMIVEVFC